MKQESPDRLTLWGGIECTINRIGDTYKDQLKYSGHYVRPGDIEAIADLGIKTIRYPVLWEKHQPKKNAAIDWSWTDRQMDTIHASGMKPIAGLVHHGSGPSYTHLLDPDFPYLLAGYAFEVASRYPWIRDYTPVNEPLTTARFSGLYGLWYPHDMNEESFYRMLLNQLKAIVLSMEAIRCVNPAARLVQTEDLGKTYSTPLLSYQASFENDRRFLTFDILSGRLQPGHPQYDHMRGCGIGDEEIDFFQVHCFAPDILGLNYYVTSERWLDEKIENYPHHTHGGNGKQQYADTEVVRANLPVRGGFKTLATEIWERYGIPIAVTECHLHCTREEQLRWFKEIWDDSISLKDKGIDVKGVTAWALLGSFDWDTLLTKTGSQYESGVFDIKRVEGQLHPTAIATLLKNLAAGLPDQHPVLEGFGWWHGSQKKMISNGRPVVILKKGKGKYADEIHSEKLATALNNACNQRCILNIVADHLDEMSVERLNPWAVIHLGSNNLTIDLSSSWKQSLSITNRAEEKNRVILTISVGTMPMTIHQINKVLDLMIDGEGGNCFFSRDEMEFITEDIPVRFHIA